MFYKKTVIFVLIMLLALTGCTKSQNPSADTGTEQSGNDEKSTSSVEFAKSDDEMFTDRDKDAEFSESDSIIITFNGDTAECSSDTVKVSGSTVTVISEGTYIFRGNSAGGKIVVDAGEKDKPHLVLDGVSITNETFAPLYIVQADKVTVTLAKDSQNTLSNGGTFELTDDNNVDGAVFSKQDLSFNGSGSLSVISPAGHGIVCKDDLVFTGGSFEINCAYHGLDANDSVRYMNADISITAGKDGIHAENDDDESLGFIYVSSGSMNITCEGDGISAAAYMQAEGGEFEILSGGGSENAAKSSSDSWGGFNGGSMMPGGGGMRPGGGMSTRPMSATTTVTETETSDSSTSIKGIKVSGELRITNGSFKIDSADDAIHSNTSITVSGGSFDIASGDDGFHADETLAISGGTIDVTESYEGLEALDIAVSGGDIKLKASDDGLNAAGGTDMSGMGGMRPEADSFGGRGGMGGMGSSSNGSIVISGGTLYVNASGDGLDANGTLEISGGHTTVVGPTQGDTATLDYDLGAVIKGGTFIGTGASGMAQTFSSSKQGVISLSVGSQTAGTLITVKDAGGNTVISYAPELNFAVVILSCPEMKSGESYTVSVGDTTEQFEAS